MSGEMEGNRARIARLTAFMDALAARANTLADSGYTDPADEHNRIVREAAQQMTDQDFLKQAHTTFDSGLEEDLPWVE